MKTVPTATAQPVGEHESGAQPDQRHAFVRMAKAGDAGLGRLVEAVAAILVVSEVILLGAGTAARYVFSKPFPWSDELASLLFIWLAVLGSVIALRRSEHMRLTAFIQNVRADRRAWLDALALMLVSAVLLAMLVPSYEHFVELRIGFSPVIGISEGWRGAAVFVGIALMLLTALQRLVLLASPRQILGSLAIVGMLVALLTWFAPALEDVGNANLILFFVVLLFLF